MDEIRVVLVEDHNLVRAGLRSLLEDREDVVVVGEETDGRGGVQAALRTGPDLVLMDISLPELNGIEATRRILEEQPRTRVLVLSVHADEEYVYRALRAGASGYLLKEADREELELAIRSVMRGDVYLSPAISDAVVERYLERDDEDLPVSPLDLLTPRQREVLQLVAEGNTTKKIADKLDLSAKTVESHRAAIMDRLGIRDVTGLVRFAVRTGLVSPEE